MKSDHHNASGGIGSSSLTPAVHYFADCVVDTARRTLMRRGQSVEVQRFTFDLLAFFMRNPGRAIAKGELLVSVWGTMHRSDTVVARAVMKLRDAIGDDGSEPRIVKTIHRYGYRWDEPVRVELVNSAARPALDERSNRLTDDGGA